MAEIELTSTEADALSGTTDSETDFKYHTIAESTYYTEGFRQRHRVLAILKTLGNRFRVYKDGTATFGVRAGKLDDGDTTYTYAATTGQSLTNDQTNYIYLSIASGALALTVNTTGFPDPSTTPHLPLASIAMGSGTYDHSDITDCRQCAVFSLIHGMAAANGNTLSDGSNADSLHTHGTIGLDANAVSASKLAAAVQDMIPDLNITGGAEAADKRTITLQARDAAGNNLAERVLVRVWIAPGEYGAPDATGNTVAVETGTTYETEAANAAYKIISDATGKVDIGVTISGAASRYVMAEIDGRIYSSGQLDWAA